LLALETLARGSPELRADYTAANQRVGQNGLDRPIELERGENPLILSAIWNSSCGRFGAMQIRWALFAD
jgi:hypothetical protein